VAGEGQKKNVNPSLNEKGRVIYEYYYEVTHVNYDI
jgi:hypothetical protein